MVSERFVRAHLFISGMVQGVMFRSNMKRIAKMYGVTGWVMNLSDGRVEAVLEGLSESVNKVIAWAHHGPVLAVVDNVSVKWETYRGEFSDFMIKYF